MTLRNLFFGIIIFFPLTVASGYSFILSEFWIEFPVFFRFLINDALNNIGNNFTGNSVLLQFSVRYMMILDLDFNDCYYHFHPYLKIYICGIAQLYFKLITTT